LKCSAALARSGVQKIILRVSAAAVCGEWSSFDSLFWCLHPLFCDVLTKLGHSKTPFCSWFGITWYYSCIRHQILFI